MKKIIIICITILMFACLKPPRDNEFDPDNPDKASLTGYIESPEGKVKNAKIKILTADHELYDSTFSDPEGKYEFSEIDPGIYSVLVFHTLPYYHPIDYYPESLPAGTADTLDFYFSTMMFNFDNDSVGTTEPFDFKRIAGFWSVQNDNTAPSQPHVYNCNSQYGLALYNQAVNSFAIGIHFKFVSHLDTLTQAGVVLKLQDSLNYYIVSVSAGILAFCKVKNGDTTIIDVVPNIIMQNEWCELWVDVCDNNFKIYFNGDLKIEKLDNEFGVGKTGLWVYRAEPPQVSVNFDNVTICR
ncbi:MAG: carboxypeptidase-like regulatory domain-containing protein [candidate division WOR-3 bacterium]